MLDFLNFDASSTLEWTLAFASGTNACLARVKFDKVRFSTNHLPRSAEWAGGWERMAPGLPNGSLHMQTRRKSGGLTRGS